jgi:hypothetical protein
MNKKNLLIGAGILGVVLALWAGFFWYMKTSSTSHNQAWATYTQRLDSGDVISIDYPTGLVPQAYQISPEEMLYISTTTTDHVRDIRFNPRSNAESIAIFDIVQSLPKSQTEIAADKKSFEGANQNDMHKATGMNTKQSRWHLGMWTAYETSDPSDNYYYDFNINGRSLDIQLSVFSEADIERVMSSIKLNGVQMSKLDSMQNWDWPALKTGN